MKKEIKKFYSKEYIKKNPNLHKEDSDFKAKLVIPNIDKFIEETGKKEYRMIDIGAGSGAISYKLKNYYSQKGIILKIDINDLSPAHLAEAKKLLKEADFIKGDIRELKLKKYDLAICLDVVEHTERPKEFITRIMEICDCAILKVPLENSFFFKLFNIFSLGKWYRNLKNQFGHIYFFNKKSIMQIIDGEICNFMFSNMYERALHENSKKMNLKKIYPWMASKLSRLCPSASARIFSDCCVFSIYPQKN